MPSTLTLRAGIALSCLVAAPALAEPKCGPTEGLLSALANEYNEKPAFVLSVGDGMPAVLLMSPAGTITVIVSPAPGMSCIVLAGRDWKAIEEAAPQRYRPAPPARGMKSTDAGY